MTKKEILEKYYRNHRKRIPYITNVYSAMDEYADQQTAEKDEELNGYKLQYNEAVEHINGLYEQIGEMKQDIADLEKQNSVGRYGYGD